MLVVDDEPLLAAMVKQMLERLGYDVVFTQRDRGAGGLPNQ